MWTSELFSMKKCGPSVWTSLDYLGPLCTIVDHCGLLWTIVGYVQCAGAVISPGRKAVGW